MNVMRRRVFMNGLVMALSGLAAFIGLFFLVWILGYVTVEGYGAINWTFFTQLPSPPGVDGGLSSAIVGTLIMTVLAALIEGKRGRRQGGPSGYPRGPSRRGGPYRAQK